MEYRNGPLLYFKYKRAVHLQVCFYEGPKSVIDETDYVKELGLFYSGDMVQSIGENDLSLTSISAGILVQRGHTQMVTASYQGLNSSSFSLREALA